MKRRPPKSATADEHKRYWDERLQDAGLRDLTVTASGAQRAWTFPGASDGEDQPAPAPVKHTVYKDGKAVLTEIIVLPAPPKKYRDTSQQVTMVQIPSETSAREPICVDDGLAILGADSSSASLADHPGATYWRLAAQHAHDLPKNFKGRRFIFDACETGNKLASARKNHLTHQQARTIWDRFEARWRSHQ